MAEALNYRQVSLARLIVESAFMAAEHDLYEDADIIRVSLSDWIEKPEDILRSEVVILMSSRRYGEAAALLSGSSMNDCVALYRLLKEQDNYYEPNVSQ